MPFCFSLEATSLLNLWVEFSQLDWKPASPGDSLSSSSLELVFHIYVKHMGSGIRTLTLMAAQPVFLVDEPFFSAPVK